MAKKSVSEILSIGESLKEGQTLAIASVRFDKKEEGSAGYDLCVVSDAKTGKKYHSFSTKIISQLEQIVEEMGTAKFAEPIEAEIVGSPTKSGYTVLSLA